MMSNIYKTKIFQRCPFKMGFWV